MNGKNFDKAYSNILTMQIVRTLVKETIYVCVMNAKNGPNINSVLIIQGCCVMSDNYKG